MEEERRDLRSVRNFKTVQIVLPWPLTIKTYTKFTFKKCYEYTEKEILWKIPLFKFSFRTSDGNENGEEREESINHLKW